MSFLFLCCFTLTVSKAGGFFSSSKQDWTSAQRHQIQTTHACYMSPWKLLQPLHEHTTCVMSFMKQSGCSSLFSHMVSVFPNPTAVLQVWQGNVFPSHRVHVCVREHVVQLQRSHWVRSLMQPGWWLVMWLSRTTERGASWYAKPSLTFDLQEFF